MYSLWHHRLQLWAYDPFPEYWERFLAAGGKMILIMQVPCLDETADLAKRHKPLAMHIQGETVDQAFQAGKMDTIRDACKRVRDLGTVVGSAHTSRKRFRLWKSGAGISISMPAAFITARAPRRMEEGAQWGNTGNGPRDLRAERPTGNVQRDATESQALLRLQGPGGGKNPGWWQHGTSLPHGFREPQTH